jgi:hypothetical protein
MKNVVELFSNGILKLFNETGLLKRLRYAWKLVRL